MIARIWHGVVPSDKSDEYVEYLNQTGVPDLRATPGNKEVKVHRRKEEDLVHFLLISYWDSLDSIAAFAGSDIDKARYYPRDREYLLELEPGVLHYEVLESE
ncbi:MAG: antibiotic biosynthesis monooxygenase family protein, partial [Anaerolineales bacterium]|jgi:heme-degrading monooxygenase HmoA